MGCGSSKDVSVAPYSQALPYNQQATVLQQNPPQVIVHDLEMDSNKSGNTDDFNTNGPFPSTLNKNFQQKISKDNSSSFQLEGAGFSASDPDVLLPPPLPATSSKKELLQGVKLATDPLREDLSDSKNIVPASDISLEKFTKDILLPQTTGEVERHVQFVNTQSTPPPSDKEASDWKPASEPKPEPKKDPDSDEINMADSKLSKEKPKGIAMGGQDLVAEQVRMQMDQLKEQQKAAEELRKTDKERRQQSLKEKLKQRSELKKKKLAAAAGLQDTQQVSQEIQEAEEPKLRDLTLDPSATNIAPQPSLPVTKKEVLYSEENIELFRDLEQYAVNMEKVTSEAVTFAILMESLLITQLSDIEKVRILFHWTTAQDLNSINFPSSIEEDTPLGFLLAIKQDRKTYASLFLRLCGAASLHGKQITGFLKGVGYYPDYKFKGKNDPFRGSWNAVLVDGQWRIVDTNWGARHVTEEEQVSSGSWQTEYKYEEHYFLTDADQLINTHFPDEPDWQLLPQPITLEEFEKSTKLWPLFYKLKLEQLPHQEGIINADDNGYVKIQLKISQFARADAKFKGDLRPRNKQSTQHAGQLLQHLFHYSKDDTENFEVFLPSTGQYLLKIFGLSTKYSEKDVYTNICLYQINCSNMKGQSANAVVLPPFPKLSTVYGPTTSGSETVAKPISHPGPIVECDGNGEAKVTMCVTASDQAMSFSHDLIDSSATPGTLSDRVVHTINTKPGSSEVTFTIRSPRQGNYALALYSNVADTSSGTFVPFCYYLVSSKQQKEETQPFPAIPNGRLGPMEPKFSESSLSVVSCYPFDQCDWKIGSLKTDGKGECNIVFGHSKPLTMLADFSCANTTSSLNAYTSVQTSGKHTIVTVRTPVDAVGNAVFALKVYAAEWDQTQNIPSVFLTFVYPETQPNTKIEAFPQSPSRTWGPSGIAFGKHGLKKISFTNSEFSMSKQFAAMSDEISSCGSTRIYNGGEDFEMNLALEAPLQLKARLLPIDGNPNASFDNFVLLGKADVQSTSIRLRIVQAGVYSLVVYGCSLDDPTGQLSPLIYTLVQATAPSRCLSAFPTTFGVWTSSARNLLSPLSGEIEKNHEVIVKIFLAQFQNQTGAPNAWTVAPYSDAMLVVDGRTPITPTTASEGNYEWKYVPGPGEKMVGVLVKPNAQSESMTYALQFKIV